MESRPTPLGQNADTDLDSLYHTQDHPRIIIASPSIDRTSEHEVYTEVNNNNNLKPVVPIVKIQDASPLPDSDLETSYDQTRSYESFEFTTRALTETADEDEDDFMYAATRECATGRSDDLITGDEVGSSGILRETPPISDGDKDLLETIPSTMDESEWLSLVSALDEHYQSRLSLKTQEHLARMQKLKSQLEEQLTIKQSEIQERLDSHLHSILEPETTLDHFNQSRTGYERSSDYSNQSRPGYERSRDHSNQSRGRYDHSRDLNNHSCDTVNLDYGSPDLYSYKQAPSVNKYAPTLDKYADNLGSSFQLPDVSVYNVTSAAGPQCHVTPAADPGHVVYHKEKCRLDTPIVKALSYGRNPRVADSGFTEEGTDNSRGVKTKKNRSVFAGSQHRFSYDMMTPGVLFNTPDQPGTYEPSPHQPSPYQPCPSLSSVEENDGVSDEKNSPDFSTWPRLSTGPSMTENLSPEPVLTPPDLDRDIPTPTFLEDISECDDVITTDNNNSDVIKEVNKENIVVVDVPALNLRNERRHSQTSDLDDYDDLVNDRNHGDGRHGKDDGNVRGRHGNDDGCGSGRHGNDSEGLLSVTDSENVSYRVRVHDKYARHLADMEACYEGELRSLRHELMTSRDQYLANLRQSREKRDVTFDDQLILKNRVQLLEENNKSYAGRVEQLENALSEGQRDCTKKQRQISRLDCEMDNAERRVTMYMEDAQKLMEEHEKLRKDHRSAQNSLSAAESLLSAAESQVYELRNELTDYKGKISRLEIERLSLERKNEQLKSKIPPQGFFSSIRSVENSPIDHNQSDGVARSLNHALNQSDLTRSSIVQSEMSTRTLPMSRSYSQPISARSDSSNHALFQRALMKYRECREPRPLSRRVSMPPGVHPVDRDISNRLAVPTNAVNKVTPINQVQTNEEKANAPLARQRKTRQCFGKSPRKSLSEEFRKQSQTSMDKPDEDETPDVSRRGRRLQRAYTQYDEPSDSPFQGSSDTSTTNHKLSFTSRTGVTDRVTDIAELENQLNALSVNKRTVETALGHIPIRANRQERLDKEHLDTRLDEIHAAMAALRLQLKKYHVLETCR